jgi:hypothetical protein
MKWPAFKLVSLLSLLLAAGSAIAQSVDVHAKIPFNFAVGNKTLPAGPYDIGSVDHVNLKLLVVQFRNGSSKMIAISNTTESLKPADKTRLVFNQYGNRYFLSEIWVNGAKCGQQLPKSSREKELAKDVAPDRTRRVEIAVSVLR